MSEQMSGTKPGQLKIWSSFLARAIVISIFILLVWFAWFTMASEFGYRFYAETFGLSRQAFVILNLAGMLGFKMACFVFFLIPYAAVKWIELKHRNQV